MFFSESAILHNFGALLKGSLTVYVVLFIYFLFYIKNISIFGKFPDLLNF